jgi:Domain of Unknown Function with PDB structure (DUF3857)
MMSMKTVLTVLLCCSGLLSVGQSGPVAVTNASKTGSDSLKTGAHAIYRLYEEIVDVTGPGQFTEKDHEIVTILDKKGERHLRQVQYLSKRNRVDNAEVIVHRYHKKDFTRTAYNDEISIASDLQVLDLEAAAPDFPCTVETKVENSYHSSISLPNAVLYNNEQAIELFRYLLKVPATLKIRYRMHNLAMEPTITDEGAKKVYVWEVRNLAAKKYETGGYSLDRYYPWLEIVPTEFEFDGHAGTFNNWKDFGQWNYALYEEQKTFPDQRIAEIRDMTAGISDKRAKVRFLYDYLKKNMRYVSIQLGIGGFQPFSPSFVDEKRYGDCKALTNYMRNLLSAVGIPSYAALVNSEYDQAPVDEDFPTQRFNHVILCIPFEKDSVWLECTSNQAPMGFLGSFTENKNVLLLTAQGGVLVKTPASNYHNNQLFTVTDVDLKSDGSAIADTRLFTKGDIASPLYETRQYATDMQKEMLVKYFEYKEFEDFVFSPLKDSADGYSGAIKMAYEKLQEFNAGSKYFFPQHIGSLCRSHLKTDEARSTDYLFSYPYERRDTTTYHLPPNFSTEHLPAAVSFSNELASYTKTAKKDGHGNIVLVSELLLKSQRVPPDKYLMLAQFFARVHREEAEKIILLQDDKMKL